ncbi:MAG: hypothetical protein POELPBGB_02078 [Bacteroidia bacterium]|nr:hypothetical protein [Bacteroidia bacterium]
MGIADKYISTSSEKIEQEDVSSLTDTKDAFGGRCCELILHGYDRVRDSKEVKNNWDEEDISDFLAEHIENYCREHGLPFHIDTDSRDRNASVDGINIKGKKRKRFDIKFSYFSDPRTENIYGVEAKNLTEKNSSSLITAYVSDKGMKKFIAGVYRKKGCMIGYIREGDTNNIIGKINARIKEGDILEETEILKSIPLLAKFKHHYESNHLGYIHNPLKHLFLDFTVM